MCADCKSGKYEAAITAGKDEIVAGLRAQGVTAETVAFSAAILKSVGDALALAEPDHTKRVSVASVVHSLHVMAEDYAEMARRLQ